MRSVLTLSALPLPWYAIYRATVLRVSLHARIRVHTVRSLTWLPELSTLHDHKGKYIQISV
jgi:hypothetical protein